MSWGGILSLSPPSHPTVSLSLPPLQYGGDDALCERNLRHRQSLPLRELSHRCNERGEEPSSLSLSLSLYTFMRTLSLLYI